MGNCSSSDSTSSVATVKLISHDGSLQEFSYPVKVSYVLQHNPSTFICNSDDMEFDNVVTAISDHEELQLGQLYFALPLSRLRRPLQPEDMAALAVKASSALGGCRRRNGPVVAGETSCVKSSGRVVDDEAFRTRSGRSGGGAAAADGGGRRRKIMTMSPDIPE